MFPIPVIALLALWISVPSFVLEYSTLSSAAQARVAQWETLALLLLPLTGIAAAIYGSLTGKWRPAFLVGIGPYLPLLFLGLPKAPIPLVIGVPMGSLGSGAALFRGGDMSRTVGFALFGTAVAAWIFVVSRITSG
jgi:hypothetical protein